MRMYDIAQRINFGSEWPGIEAWRVVISES